jgi:hypothetical protein
LCRCKGTISLRFQVQRAQFPFWFATRKCRHLVFFLRISSDFSLFSSTIQ